MSEWTPTDDEVEDMFVTGWCCCDTDPATAGARPSDAYRRWLAAHDRALREQIAREIENVITREASHLLPQNPYHNGGLRRAARIVRGEGSE